MSIERQWRDGMEVSVCRALSPVLALLKVLIGLSGDFFLAITFGAFFREVVTVRT